MNYTESFLAKAEAALNRPLRIGFVGLGVSNLSLLNRVCDGRREITLRCDDPAEIPPAALARLKGLRRGRRALEDINEDILILSPSVRREREELCSAAARGVILTSDTEIFFSEFRGVCLGVTGSDGKSTTVTLARNILTESGRNAEAVGNIGVPFSEFLGEIAVAELSSFMLHYIIPPISAALITSVTPNHLNWHDSFEEYKEAKFNILKKADRAILSADDGVSASMAGGVRPYAVYSTILSHSELMEKYRPSLTYTVAEGYIRKNGERLIPLSELHRRESYNLKNLMGALSLTEGYATEEGAIRAAEDFRGLPHRAEPVGIKRGVSYINSSIDTTPERVATTLSALGRRVLILLGGQGKELPLEPLIPMLGRYAVRIAAYGKEGERIARELVEHSETADIPRAVFQGFDAALDYLIRNAKEGDTVILCPAACAYGEFKSYQERGARFCEAVAQL